MLLRWGTAWACIFLSSHPASRASTKAIFSDRLKSQKLFIAKVGCSDHSKRRIQIALLLGSISDSIFSSFCPLHEKAHQKNKRSESTLLAKLVCFFPDQGSLQALLGMAGFLQLLDGEIVATV